MEAVRRRGRVLLLALMGSLPLVVGPGMARGAEAAKPAAQPAAKPAAPAAAERIGAEVCLQCHSQYQKEWYTLRHNRFRKSDSAPETLRGCEGCHGPGSAHLEDEKFGHIKNPRKATGLAAVQMCFQCHGTDRKISGWLQTPHAKAGVNCGSCHEMHKETQQPALLKAKTTALCLSCHPDQEPTFRLNSHHPVLEERMTCTDCHDVHNEGLNSRDALKAGNDRCIRCHLEKQGPFLFEHQTTPEPGDANCLSCHVPHGSANPRLTQFYGSGVCLQCHADITADPKHLPRLGGHQCYDAGCHNHLHGSNSDRQLIN